MSLNQPGQLSETLAENYATSTVETGEVMADWADVDADTKAATLRAALGRSS